MYATEAPFCLHPFPTRRSSDLKLRPPDEKPDHDFPFVLTTGRQLEHWHTGAMTRRASNLDALEPAPTAALSRNEIARLGIDRKSTRLNSSHANISYAVFCLKKK